MTIPRDVRNVMIIQYVYADALYILQPMPKYLHHIRRIHGITSRCSDFGRKKATLIYLLLFLFIFMYLFLFFDQYSRLWSTVLRERNWQDRLLFILFIPPYALKLAHSNIVLRARALVTLIPIIWHLEASTCTSVT